jgi:molybdopterin synthase catalytic subunit
MLAEVGDASAGATALFVGSVRDHSEKGRVFEIHYESYREMAEKAIAEIESEIMKRWHVKKVLIVHRIGTLGVGEASVAVAVSAEHRKEAFDACRYGIDTVKARVPIWKKEVLENGAAWAEGVLPEGD